MKKVVFQRSDGGVSIITLNEKQRQPGETDDDFARRMGDKDAKEILKQPDGTFAEVARAYVIVDESSILTDRTFRDAWKLDQTDIKVDMAKAREIRKAALLALRNQRLAAAKEELEAALDDGDKVKEKEIRDKRKKLRAVDAVIDADMSQITTPEALAQYRPTELQ